MVHTLQRGLPPQPFVILPYFTSDSCCTYRGCQPDWRPDGCRSSADAHHRLRACSASIAGLSSQLPLTLHMSELLGCDQSVCMLGQDWHGHVNAEPLLVCFFSFLMVPLRARAQSAQPCTQILIWPHQDLYFPSCHLAKLSVKR